MVDDHLAVVVDIAVTVALLGHNRIVVVAIAVANHIVFMDYVNVPVAMTFADGHARTDRAGARPLPPRRPAGQFR